MRTEIVARVQFGVPTVAELSDLEAELKVMIDAAYALERPNALFWTRPELLPEVKANLTALPQLRRLFEAVDTPATSTDIAGEVAKLCVVFANSTGKDPDLFAEVFASDVEDARPTKYELAVAGKSYRRNYRFLGLADYLDELQSAHHSARRWRELFDNLELAGPELSKIEARLPQLTAERRTTERRRKVLCAIYRYLERQGRELDFQFKFGFDRYGLRNLENWK